MDKKEHMDSSMDNKRLNGSWMSLNEMDGSIGEGRN